MGNQPSDDATLAADTIAPTPSPGNAEFGLDTVAATQPTAGPQALVGLERGDHVGRYVILGRLGQGGMGVVYAAYDPQLDRKVALKLVLGPHGGGAQGQRLLREAQALARLSHPNVVAVHDVGTVDGRVFIAMEFVEGRTLGEWMGDSPSIEERLDAMRAAGRGLLEAHRAGLLHRDFKPDNVMIDAQGRVRVMDFGLARERSVDDEAAPTARDHSGSSDSALSNDLTRTGALMGTPAYMSPEQYAGGEIDERADQFAFFVVLFELLYGHRPFRADTFMALADKVCRGEHEPIPQAQEVPVRIRNAIERGLLPKPGDRYPDMAAVLAELEPQASRAWTYGVMGAALASLLGVGALAWSTAAQDPCAEAARPVNEMWNAAQAGRIREAYEALQLPFAAAAADKVVGELDAHAERHRALRRQLCEATHVTKQQSEALMDRRLACVDDRARKLHGAIEVLARVDAETAQRGLQIVVGIDSPEPCADIRSSDARYAPPPESAREAVADLQAQLAEADAELNAGLKGDALTRLREMTDAVQETGYLPLRAEHQYALADAMPPGQVERLDGFREAMSLAAELGDDEAMLRGALTLAEVAGTQAGAEEGRRWLAMGEGMVHRRGDGLRDRVNLARARGAIAHRAGDVHGALDAAAEAVRLQKQAAPDDWLNNAQVNVFALDAANVAMDTDAALGYADDALRYYRVGLGEDHPFIGAVLLSQGGALVVRGKVEEGSARLNQGLALLEAAVGPDSPFLAGPYSKAATELSRAGRFDRGEELFKKAIAQVGEGEDSALEEAAYRSNYGTALWFAGRFADALPQHERALELRRKLYAPEHLEVALAEDNLASTYLMLGRFDESLTLHEAALPKIRDALGPDHPSVGVSCYDQASTLLAMKRFDDALVLLECADGVYARAGDALDPRQRFDVQVTIIETLERLGQTGRAQTMKAELRQGLAAFGPGAQPFIDRLEGRGPQRGG